MVNGYDARLLVNEDLIIVCLPRKYVGKKTEVFVRLFEVSLLTLLFGFVWLRYCDIRLFFVNGNRVLVRTRFFFFSMIYMIVVTYIRLESAPFVRRENL